MLSTARRLLMLTVLLTLSACVPQPPPPTPAFGPAGRIAVAPPPPSTDKAAARLRPRLLGRSLTREALTPSAPLAPLAAALYAPEQDPGLRSAGLRQLAAQHLTRGHPGAAVAAARAGHVLAQDAYGPDHPETLSALLVLSDALDAAGRRTEAEAVLLLARGRASRLFGPAHPAAVGAADRLAVVRARVPLGPLLRSVNRQVNRIS